MNKKEPLIKQGWLRVFVFCICIFIFQVLSGLLLALLLVGFKVAANTAEAVQQITDINSSVISLAIVITFNFFTSLLLVFLFRKLVDRKTIYSLGWDFFDHKSHAVVGLFVSIACIGLGTLVLIVMKNLRFTGWNIDAGDIGFALGLLILVAVAEELVFRGYILNNLMQSTNKYAALMISSLIFALAHGANPNFSWLALVNIFLAGLLLGINYIYTQNLWYAVIFHFSWNFFQGPILGYEVSGTNLPGIFQMDLTGNDLITGGKFGFEGSIIASVVMIIFIVVLFIAYNKKNTALSAEVMQ
ncbi:MAG: lysostaphin resistance A-like protein [Sphingobacteriales bacterium]